jgi:RNA polymerase sigma-70 factor (ECF subfamily)
VPGGNPSDLEQLVRAWMAAEDKAGAFDAIFLACRRMARRYFMRMGAASEADAEDLAQEALWAVYSRLETLRNPSLFEAFFYRILHCKLASYFRRHYRRSKAEICLDESELGAIAYQGLEPDQAAYFSEVFSRAKARLTRHQLLCFNLVVMGCDAKEIAGGLGIRERTVRVHMHKARLRLRDLRR